MAEISKEQAQKILERNGYTVSAYLGGGAASHAFKASRKSQKDPTKKKEVAAKVCAPQGNSWASLKDELEAAEELKKLKKDFKSKLEKAKREGQGELVKEYEKKWKHFFKYLTVPKLKLELPDVITDDGKKLEVAVFEAPLADSDLWHVEIDSKTYKVGKEPNPYREGRNRTVVSNLSVNYSDLKKVIKGILKGLKLVHDEGKSHGDIRISNILKKPGASEGKYRYSVTDFGTLKPDETGEGRKKDLKNASRVLLAMWLRYLCAYDYEISSNAITGDFDEYCKTLLGGGYAIPVLIPPDYNDQFLGVYHPTNDDKKLIEFCQRLYEGKKLKSADDALADPWLI